MTWGAAHHVSITGTKWKKRSWKRSTSNTATVISGIICLLAAAAWVRSQWASDAWFFRPRTVQASSGMSGQFRSSRWIGSSAGNLILADITFPEQSGTQEFWELHKFFGYKRASAAWPLLPPLPMTITAENHVRGTGFGFHQLNSVCKASPQGTRQWAGQYRERETRIAWWLMVACSSFLPLVWGSRWEARMWLERRRQKKIRQKICLKCGYDIRATPERCSKCGQIQIQTMGETPIPT